LHDRLRFVWTKGLVGKGTPPVQSCAAALEGEFSDVMRSAPATVCRSGEVRAAVGASHLTAK